MNQVMELEGERKKRKITYHEEEEEEEEDEEVKMEKFFALIRSVKDIRDQLRDSRNSMQPENQRPPPASPAAAAATTIAPATRATAKRVQDQSKGKTAVWKPCFEPKNVAGNSQVSKTDLNLIAKQVATTNSSRRSEEEKHEADHNNKTNNNENNFQAGKRNRIGFDLNLFPVPVTDLDSTDVSK